MIIINKPCKCIYNENTEWNKIFIPFSGFIKAADQSYTLRTQSEKLLLMFHWTASLTNQPMWNR